MNPNTQVVRLTIQVSSTDKHRNEILYEHLVFLAKKQGLAGATVTRGIMGFGASSVIHSYKFWEITDKVPVVIELVDEEEKISMFYDSIKGMLENMRYGCLVTISNVEVLLYKAGQKKLFGADQ